MTRDEIAAVHAGALARKRESRRNPDSDPYTPNAIRKVIAIGAKLHERISPSSAPSIHVSGG